MKHKNMLGFKVGELEVIAFSHILGTAHWLCSCSCGNEKIISGASLRSKKPTVSCGCLLLSGKPNSSHGMSSTPTYETYRAMRKRCESPNDKEFKNYGGRGISIAEEWLTFDGFFADMGVRPEGMTLDRIDTNGHYCKTNCRWATPKEQAMNRRNSYNLTYNGITKHISEWSSISDINIPTIKRRLEYGWDVGKAIFTENKRKRNKD